MQGRRHSQPSAPPRKIDRGRGYKRVDASRVEVYDLDIAAWLHFQKVPIADAYKSGREVFVTFHDPETEDRIAKLMVDWLNSESAAFASSQRQLKKVIWATGRERPPR